MTDRPTFYDLPPVGVLDFGRMVEWECPVIPCDKRVLVADLAAKLHSGPLALRLGESLGDHPHPDPQVRDKLMNAEAELYAHIGRDHDWSAILLAMAASEAIYDEQIADQNRENERAWGFNRMLLKRLEEIHQAIETFELESATVPAIEALVSALLVFSAPPSYSTPPEPVPALQSVVEDPADTLLAQSEAEGALARQEAAQGCSGGCQPVYYCPTSGEEESPCHGGFDVCCDAPELHVPR